jgi:hypothetical protein
MLINHANQDILQMPKGIIFENEDELREKYANINDKTDEEKLNAIYEDWSAIKYINDPSEEMQIVAIRQDTQALLVIKNPTIRVQEEAILINPFAFIDIDNPSDELIMKALEKDVEVFRFIKEPTIKMMKYLIIVDYFLIRSIKNPPPQIQLFALSMIDKTDKELQSDFTEMMDLFVRNRILKNELTKMT